MLSLAHIVNPVIVPEQSDLFVAQPVTFETMRRAREAARSEVELTLLTAQFPEDRALVPDDFISTPDLDRSALDLQGFKVRRKLPLMKDILDRLYAHAPEADFLIYTNVDIAVMPQFYSAIAQIIDQGFDAFVINRRTISADYQRVDEIPLMYSEVGEPHPGYDCFVFRRDSYPRFDVASAFIGVPPIGRVLLVNLICNAERYGKFKDLHLTFHIGDARAGRTDAYADYDSRNRAEYEQVLAHHARCLDKLDEAQMRDLLRFGQPNPEALPSRARVARRFIGKVRRAARRWWARPDRGSR